MILTKQKKVHILVLTVNVVGFLKKLPYSGHEYAEDIWMFTTNFIINYDENSDVGYTLAAGVEYSQYLHPSHRDLLFFPEKKKNCSYHIRLLQQALNMN